MATSGILSPWSRMLPSDVPPKVVEEFKKWINDSKNVNIFVMGKTGTGKSTLVNGLVGREAAKEGNSLKPETSKIELHMVDVGGIVVRIWDSPGLFDETEHENDYVEELKEKSHNMDLYLFCIPMSDTRLTNDSSDIKAMKLLTEELGEGFWDNTVIILTFANEVVAMGECEVEDDNEKAMQDYFTAQMTKWAERLQTFLKKELSLEEELVKRIKIVPAGHASEPKLPDGTGAYWMTKLCLECLTATRPSAQPALLKVNRHRIVEDTQDEQNQHYGVSRFLYEQPLILAKKGEEIGAYYDVSSATQGWMFGKAIGIRETARLDLSLMIKNESFS